MRSTAHCTSRFSLAAALAIFALCDAASAADRQAVASLADLSLEQLSNIEVTSASGRAESLQDAPTSIYVITGDDIRRSAATSLPEALRLAPNLQVARLNAAQYAISARGFNNAIGNKLLVLVDGRTIYSPLFSGVFWDANDVVLEDIERIEVISGPGGTLWGANAVNGVINVITKPAGATQGPMVSALRSKSSGYEVARWGAALGEAGHYRVYAMAMDHDNTTRPDGVDRLDQASKRQAGFRADWSASPGRFTVQGDAYEGGEYPANNLAPKMSGANLLARWTGSFSGGAPFKLQAYVDHTDRDDVNAFRDRSSTMDVQFTHEPLMPPGRQLLWGAGYRQTHGSNDPGPIVLFMPAEKTLHWSNIFVQHDLRLQDKWDLVVGAKAERNDYTGVEFLPNARISYKHSPQATTWAAVSRAVRAPARLDRELFSPGTPPYTINGGPQFQSEIANVAEIGHRGYAAPGVNYSITAFTQRYTRLRSGSAPPITVVNQIEGILNGVEGWATWQASDAWRLSAGFTAMRGHFHTTRGTPDPAGIAGLGNDPRHQWNLRSSLNLGTRGEFDVMVRKVGSLPSPAIAGYTAVDARLAFKVTPGFELSVLGQNLFDGGHVEFNAPASASHMDRRIFIKAVWQL